MARVLFVLRERSGYPGYPGYPGYLEGAGLKDQPASTGLYNSGRFIADWLGLNGVETKIVHVNDANDIHREIVAFAATHCVIEAIWVPPYKFDELHAECPYVWFMVRNHSEAPFLAIESMAYDWLLQYLSKISVAVCPNSPRMMDDLRFLASDLYPNWTTDVIELKVPLLPNCYPLW